MSSRRNVSQAQRSQQRQGPEATQATGTQADLTKRKRDEEESSSSSDSQFSEPLADVVSGHSCYFEPLSDSLVNRQVKDICTGFSDLIPPNAPAGFQDLNILKEMGFHFDFTDIEPLGYGLFGKIYACKFIGKRKDGSEIRKSLACKKVAINQPASRLDWPVVGMEQQIMMEMRICEIMIHHRHKNVAKHELIWQIRATWIGYQNPINHLIFMERCDGTLKDFIIQHFGYSTTNYYRAPTEFVNKIWVKHVCQGLDFLHNYNKMEKYTGVAWYSIIHHDLKHDNIMYKMRNGRVKFLIIDFGLSEIKLYPPNRDRNLNVWSSAINGTDRFQSPESMQLKRELLQAAQRDLYIPGLYRPSFYYEARKKDIYALGVMLSDCLVGFTDRTKTGDDYSVADEWLERLKDYRMRDFINSPKFSNVSHDCLSLLFRMTHSNEEYRLLASDVLQDRWLDDARLRHSFVDWTASGQSGATKRVKRNQ